jgi:WD40 repeat protein
MRVAAIAGKRIQVWEAGTGKEITRFGANSGSGGSAVALSPDGALVAATTRTEVFVMEIASASELHRELDPAGELVSMAFSPDGKRLLAAGMHRLILWNVGSWKDPVIHKLADPSTFHVAFAPSGDIFAVGRFSSLHFHDALSGDHLFDFKPYDDITDFSALAFAPDGKTIATSDDRGAVLVWDIAKLRDTLTKPTGDLQESHRAR